MSTWALPSSPDSFFRMARKKGLASPQAQLQSFNISLAAGWNLISIPLVPADTAPTSVFSSASGNYSRVQAYNNCDVADPWKEFDPGNPGAADLTALDPKIGFWINVTSATTLAVNGSSQPNTNIPLCTGWNLIGYPLSVALPVTTALASIAGKYSRVYGYDAFVATSP